MRQITSAFVFTFATALCGASAAGAQSASTKGNTGDVRSQGVITGSVTCSDTQAAARLAHVFLMSTKAESEDEDDDDLHIHPNAETMTAADGTFSFLGVIPGRYYVMAGLPGYLDTGSAALEDFSKSRDLAGVLASLPEVPVQPGVAVSTTVSLRRGATMEGDVRWQDGTPASNVNVLARAILSDGSSPAPLTRLVKTSTALNMKTDSQGHFRLTSLAAGAYTLPLTIMETSVAADSTKPSNIELISAYAPGVFFAKQAEEFKLGSGESRQGIEIQLDLSNLHSASGVVISRLPGVHMQGGGVLLYVPAADRNSAQFVAGGKLDRDGRFTIRGIPSGEYTLKADPMWADESGQMLMGDGGAIYLKFQQSLGTLIVGDADQTGVIITLLPPSGKQ